MSIRTKRKRKEKNRRKRKHKSTPKKISKHWAPTQYSESGGV